jgi:hypothetical protein
MTGPHQADRADRRRVEGQEEGIGPPARRLPGRPSVRNKHQDYSERERLTLNSHGATKRLPTRVRVIYRPVAFPYIDLKRRER